MFLTFGLQVQTFLRISYKTEEATNFSFNEFNEPP